MPVITVKPDDPAIKASPNKGITVRADELETLPAPPSAPDNSIVGGAYRRGKDILGSAASALFAHPVDMDDPTGVKKGIIQPMKEGFGQAREQFRSAQGINDPITKFLTYLRSGTTALGTANPLTTSSVTNINKLEDEGRSREAIGQGGLDAALLLLGGTNKGRATAEKVSRAPSATVRIMGQEMGGAGKEPVLKAARAREETVADATARNAAKKGEYVQKEFAARKGERGAEAVNAQKEVIKRAQGEYARLINDNLRQTQLAAKGALDARWNNLRKQMETPRQVGDTIQTSPVQGRPVADSVEQARNQYLVGSPEDLKAFDDLMGRLHDPQIADPTYAKPLGWNEARTHYSNISDRLYSGNLPGNVYKALQLVQKSLDEQLGKAAQSRGLGAEYNGLKKDWSQYKGDFDDLSSLKTKGGSPLAQAIRFQSPADLERLLNSQYGDNLLQRVSRYQDRGANPKIISTYRELGKRSAGLESPKVPAHPARPSLQSLPPEVRPYEIRLRKLEEMSGRPASIYDLYPPRALERLMIKIPAMRKWIARQPRKELQP